VRGVIGVQRVPRNDGVEVRLPPVVLGSDGATLAGVALPCGVQVLDQFAFEDLPGGAERQRRDEFDPPRMFVSRRKP